MRYFSIAIFFLFLFSIHPEVRSQKPEVQIRSVPAGYSLSQTEMKLYNMINDYRAGFNLPPIPLSKSLSYVASLHVKDLFTNHPDQAPCNFHSWSNKGQWKPFCYPRDEKKSNSVWDKPKELTGYKGKGYEIIYWENGEVNIDSIIPFWNTIDYFNSFLLNTGKWQDKKWMAIGVGIYQNYAAAWFGDVSEQPDSGAVSKPAEIKILNDTVKPKTVKEKKAIEIKKEVKPVVKAPVVEQSEPDGKRFKIIISSQQPREKSQKLASEMISKGYPDAKVLKSGDKIRVSIAEFSSKSQADSALREIKKTFIDAWILK